MLTYILAYLHAFLVEKSNSIRGFVRLWVRPSVRQAFLKNREFNKIQQNSRLFATVGRVTALF